MSAQHKQRWKLFVTIFTFTALAILIYGVRKQIGDTIDNLGKVNTWWLLLMIPLQLANYDAYTRLYRNILAVLDEHISYKSMFGIQLELNFVNHILPSGGVSGFSYFGLRMHDHKIPAGKSTLVQFMRFILIFISFQVLLLLGVILLSISGHVNNFVILIAGSIVTLLLVTTFGMGFILGSRERIKSFSAYITKLINQLIGIFRPNNPETINVEQVKNMFNELHDNYLTLRRNLSKLRRPLYASFIANLTEVLTLYVVYIAFGKWVNPGAVILAYAVANFAGLISFLPAGVGIYEGLMTAVLVATGVPAGVSIPVTVMYRVINMTIQLAPGYVLYYRHLHKKPNDVAAQQ